SPLLKKAGIEPGEVMPKRAVPPAKGDSPADLQELMATAAALVEEARELKVRRWLRAPAQLLLHLACIGLGAAPALVLQPMQFWLAGGVVAGLAAALVLRRVLMGLLTRRMRRAGRYLFGMLAQSKRLGDAL